MGDVIIPTSGETPEDIATATCVMTPGVILAGDLCIMRNPKIDGRFLSYEINHKAKYKIARIAQGKSIVHIRPDEIERISINYPLKTEQEKILKFLDLLTQKIEKQQALVDALKLYKRGVIVSLFNSLSESNDNIKLSKIGTFKSGVGFKEAYQGYLDLEIPFYKVSDMNLDGNTITMNTANNYVSNEIVKKLKTTSFNQDSIIFAKVGAALFMERKRIAHAPFLIDNNMMAYQPNADVNFEYVFAFFQNLSLSAYAQIGALPSLNASELGDIIIPMPDAQKQKKVALINKELEMQIEAHSQCLICLEEVKRGLLQQMFI